MVYEETAHAALDNSACTTVMHSYVQQAAAASCDEDKLVKMKANAEAVQSGQNIDKEINLCGGHQYIVTTLLCNVFVKYNAALPSAVAAERLFRVAGQILVPQCCIQWDVKSYFSDTNLTGFLMRRKMASVLNCWYFIL